MDTEGDNLKDILMRVAYKLGIEKWRYQRKEINGDGLNYLGNLVPVLFVDKSSGEDFHLIIKRAPQIPQLDYLIKEVYEKEVYVYSNLMPTFESLNTGINYEKLFPKCYYADSAPDNRVLVLKDMRTLGLVNYTGQHLDKDHINVSLKAIASYHAMSIILNENKIKPLNSHVLRPILSHNTEFYYKTLKYCMEKHYNILFKNTNHRFFFENLINSLANYMDDSSMKAKKLIYGHGDFWKENILFEYMDKKPVRACLVDYQITRLMSPAQDVLFLLMNGTTSSVRQKYFTTFLSTYYNELRNILCHNGVNLQAIYTEEDFHEDLHLVFPFCFILTFVSFVMWLGFENIDNIFFETEKNIPKEERKKMEDKLKRTTEDLIADFRDFGYIDY